MTILHDQSHTLVSVAVTCWLIMFDFVQMFWRFIAVILIALNIFLLAKMYMWPLHESILRLHCAAVQFHMWKYQNSEKTSHQIYFKKVQFSHNSTNYMPHISRSGCPRIRIVRANEDRLLAYRCVLKIRIVCIFADEADFRSACWRFEKRVPQWFSWIWSFHWLCTETFT